MQGSGDTPPYDRRECRERLRDKKAWQSSY
jgi:hypothetical protein